MFSPTGWASRDSVNRRAVLTRALQIPTIAIVQVLMLHLELKCR